MYKGFLMSIRNATEINSQAIKPSITVVPEPNEPDLIDPLEQIKKYPLLRYMGSKNRLLPWIYEILNSLEFTTALDPFAGSGCVAYLIKCMGKRVVASDFLNFSATLAKATIENNHQKLNDPAIKKLLMPVTNAPTFIEDTYEGIFFKPSDLRFLDQVSNNIKHLANSYQKAVAMSALIRSCLKKQPRGVFTVSGDLGKYDDGRRDLRLSIEEHFIEQIEIFNQVVFNNHKRNRASKADIFKLRPRNIDLVYLDPPYVPRSDDNCYIKRYHFLEGLSSYWKDEEIDYSTKVRKIPKRYTPFSYRREALGAFDRMFKLFRKSIIVLSYSSNGFPDLNILEELMLKYKDDVRVFEKAHKYHFGTHSAVNRSNVTEYLIVGI
jgi:adenine-specific DNA-methyltransferase